MTDVAIRVEGLSKRYRIGGQRGRYRTLRESISDTLAAPFRRAARGGGGDTEFWALKGVSFEVKRGEVVGVIGRNGAGKSTLLKLLSRITEPTEGQAEIHGRVGSLLEVGTGFHPELTGRENVFLNGAILGMRKEEIRRKFDEIVAFSEIEKFLDTPVKHYSSGMYTRLAFAVAAHLEPEILIVDEVLAVGDAQFQKKCLGKIGEVAKGGRTVLFVSHNLAAVESLCNRGLILKEGRLAFTGTGRQAVTSYMEEGVHHSAGKDGLHQFDDRRNEYLPGRLLIVEAAIRDERGAPRTQILMGDPVTIEIGTRGLAEYRAAQVGFILRTLHDTRIASMNTGMLPPRKVEAGDRQTFRFHIPQMTLLPGSYVLDLSVAQKSVGRLDFVSNAIEFDVIEADVYGSGYTLKNGDGIVFLNGEWTVGSTLSPKPLLGTA